jgi:hypothetical protein
VWRAAVIIVFPIQVLHFDQGNHGINHPINTTLSMVVYFYFKSSPHIFFQNILTQHNFSYLYNFSISPLSTIFSYTLFKPNTHYLSQSYFSKLTTTTMSQSPN